MNMTLNMTVFIANNFSSFTSDALKTAVAHLPKKYRRTIK